MLIVIDLMSYYDWVAMDGVATNEDILALRAKPSQNGKWLKKVVHEKKTYTEVNLQEAEIQDCMAHFARVGLPKTRERTVAWYLEEKVMPHHAHQDHWLDIHVHDEPAVEAFLKRHFDLNKIQAVEAKVAVPVAPKVEPKVG